MDGSMLLFGPDRHELAMDWLLHPNDQKVNPRNALFVVTEVACVAMMILGIVALAHGLPLPSFVGVGFILAGGVGAFLGPALIHYKCPLSPPLPDLISEGGFISSMEALRHVSYLKEREYLLYADEGHERAMTWKGNGEIQIESINSQQLKSMTLVKAQDLRTRTEPNYQNISDELVTTEGLHRYQNYLNVGEYLEFLSAGERMYHLKRSADGVYFTEGCMREVDNLSCFHKVSLQEIRTRKKQKHTPQVYDQFPTVEAAKVFQENLKENEYALIEGGLVLTPQVVHYTPLIQAVMDFSVQISATQLRQRSCFNDPKDAEFYCDLLETDEYSGSADGSYVTSNGPTTIKPEGRFITAKELEERCNWQDAQG